MGMIKSGLILLASFILLISFLLGNIFLIASLSLDYDTINPELTEITTNIANTESNLNNTININYPLMLETCKNQTEIQLTNYSIPYNYSVPCDTIITGEKEILNYTINEIIKKAYYKKYECKFSDCLKVSPLYLTSETYKNNLKSKFKKTLTFSIILIIILFLLVEKKKNILTLTGIVLALSTIPLTKIYFPIKILSKGIEIAAKTKIVNSYPSELIGLLFTKTQSVFNINITIATMLIVVGIGLGFLKFITKGKEKKFTKKEVEDIVEKKLIDKEKIKEKFTNLLKSKKAKKK